MPVTNALKERAKSHARSRVSNGKDLLPGVDGRSLIARRYRDISFAIFADAGGIDQCSEARQQLIRRFAACSVIAEMMEAEKRQSDQHCRSRATKFNVDAARNAHRN